MKKQCKYFSKNAYTEVFIKPRTLTKLRTFGQLRRRSVATQRHDTPICPGVIGIRPIIVSIRPVHTRLMFNEHNKKEHFLSV